MLYLQDIKTNTTAIQAVEMNEQDEPRTNPFPDYLVTAKHDFKKYLHSILQVGRFSTSQLINQSRLILFGTRL